MFSGSGCTHFIKVATKHFLEKKNLLKLRFSDNFYKAETEEV